MEEDVGEDPEMPFGGGGAPSLSAQKVAKVDVMSGHWRRQQGLVKRIRRQEVAGFGKVLHDPDLVALKLQGDVSEFDIPLKVCVIATPEFNFAIGHQLPVGLEELAFSADCNFNQPLPELPQKLRKLHLGRTFKHPLKLPSGLREVTLPLGLPRQARRRTFHPSTAAAAKGHREVGSVGGSGTEKLMSLSDLIRREEGGRTRGGGPAPLLYSNEGEAGELLDGDGFDKGGGRKAVNNGAVGTQEALQAAEHGNSALLARFLQDNGDPRTTSRLHHMRWSLLHLAAGFNDDTLTSSRPRHMRWSLLHLAVGCAGMGSALSLAGAAHRSRPEPDCNDGYAACIALLLAAGADPNATSIQGGYTPLMGAAVTGSAESCWLLLRAGANPLARTAAGQTALDFAQTPRAGAPAGAHQAALKTPRAGAPAGAHQAALKTALDFAQTPRAGAPAGAHQAALKTALDFAQTPRAGGPASAHQAALKVLQNPPRLVPRSPLQVVARLADRSLVDEEPCRRCLPLQMVARLADRSLVDDEASHGFRLVTRSQEDDSQCVEDDSPCVEVRWLIPSQASLLPAHCGAAERYLVKCWSQGQASDVVRTNTGNSLKPRRDFCKHGAMDRGIALRNNLSLQAPRTASTIIHNLRPGREYSFTVSLLAEVDGALQQSPPSAVSKTIYIPKTKDDAQWSVGGVLSKMMPRAQGTDGPLDELLSAAAAAAAGATASAGGGALLLVLVSAATPPLQGPYGTPVPHSGGGAIVPHARSHHAQRHSSAFALAPTPGGVERDREWSGAVAMASGGQESSNHASLRMDARSPVSPSVRIRPRSSTGNRGQMMQQHQEGCAVS
ncbi:hypothetical protein JKP88DRAFT_280687 [Tribonema minus]|uniref:Uncharacterized protein n=1 Tax=Tribonema minus TaxID=303371 RepID=A0A835YST7_9STRA|nr:hypothetical protein JKP88DRAFT_280687 [Tribonema minus]